MSGAGRTSGFGIRRGIAWLVLASVLPPLGGCSVRRLAIDSLGDALARGTATYARDDDPELVQQAVPFGLKTVEALLVESPRHRGMILAAASGFTQYAYAFVQCEADYLEAADLERATQMRNRAKRLYGRAIEYGWRGMVLSHPGFRAAFQKDSGRAAAVLGKDDVPLAYWTAAAWASSISLAKEDSELTADLPMTAVLMQRVLDLDELFGDGAAHDFFIAYEGGRPASAGGSIEAARRHLDRAVELSRGLRAAPLVSYAETISVSQQNRAEFERLLQRALDIDVSKNLDQRLSNLVAQKRARWLLDNASNLFIE